MTYKQISIAVTMSLILGMSEDHTAFGADGLPVGWFVTGSRPHEYDMSVDNAVKHNGKYSAHIKFIGDKPDGFGSLAQAFKADEYRGKRVCMSAWVKTENVEESAQLWMRLDGEKGILGFDNMDKRQIRGTTGWTKHDIILDVPENTQAIVFGIFVYGKGEAWADDFRFEVVGNDVPTTDMMNPELRKEHLMESAVQAPKRPMNLGFEDGSIPERKPVKVDPNIYDAYVGQYQAPTRVYTITREGDKLMFESANGPRFQVLPESETEFFVKDQPQTIIFVRNEKGKVTHYIFRFNGHDNIVKKIK